MSDDIEDTTNELRLISKSTKRQEEEKKESKKGKVQSKEQKKDVKKVGKRAIIKNTKLNQNIKKPITHSEETKKKDTEIQTKKKETEVQTKKKETEEERKKKGREEQIKKKEAEEPIVLVNAELEFIISNKAREDKYKSIKGEIKKLRKKFTEQIDRETQKRTIKIAHYNQKLKNITEKYRRSKEGSNLNVKNALIVGYKLRIIENTISHKVNNVLRNYNRLNTNLINKIHLVYEGWLYGKFYADNLLIEESVIGSLQSFIQHEVPELIMLPDTFQHTRVLMANTEYSSYSAYNSQLMKVSKSQENDARKIIKGMITEYFKEIELILKIKLGKHVRAIGLQLIKLSKQKALQREVLNKLCTLHYISSSFRTPKRLICCIKS